jgi:hypothetical protein
MVSLVQDKVAIGLRLWPMLGSHLHQIRAVPRQRPYCDHIAVWPECRSQQSHRVQKL